MPHSGALREESQNTRNNIAKEHGIGKSSVERYASMARGYNDIQQTSPEVAKKIISGQMKVSDIDLQAIDRASTDKKSSIISAVIEGKPLPKKESEPKCKPEPTPPSSQLDTPTFSFDKPISTRTKAGQQLMSEIRTVIENQGNGEIVKPTLSVVSEMLMYDVQAMIERFHDFMNTNKEIATEEIINHITASVTQLNKLKEVLKCV